ncbi:hypothetical protein NEUTE2DRAFT_55993 [Neurospora tetrasperma FGSC 2509]|nr:hypothetical protein NEUTE2DRAFT_55993 [Neurospora tetrasperma FGSC 2509]
MIHRGISPSSFWRCSCDLKLLARAAPDQKDSSGTENGPVMGGGKRFLLVPAGSRFRLPEPARSRSGLRHAMHYPMALPTERRLDGTVTEPPQYVYRHPWALNSPLHGSVARPLTVYQCMLNGTDAEDTAEAT